MALWHRALFTWFLVTVFLVLVTIRLDEKIDWDWFLVFIPMWLFDFKLIVYITFRIVTHLRSCRGGGWGHGGQGGADRRGTVPLPRKVWCLCCVLFKLSFQVTLCVRLQYARFLSWFVVMIPLWMLFASVSFDVWVQLVFKRNAV